MAFCLNPDCPHKKKIGRPAEFREGFTHCSDCGSLLSESAFESKEVIKKEDIQKAPPRIRLTDLYKRVLYTIGFVLLWRALALVPVPGINFQALEHLFGHEWFLLELFGYGSGLGKLSVVALGIMPYITAYTMVEFLSLFIRPLKTWREEGVQGRIKIKEVTIFATFLLAFIQGYGIAIGLEHMAGMAGEKIVRNPGLSFSLVSILSMTAGTFLTIWIAELITKKGLGHGISILIFAEYGPRIFSNIPQIKLVPRENSPSPSLYFLLLAIIVITLIAVIILMEKSHRKIPVRFSDSVEAYVPLKFTSAGLMPAFSGVWLIALPITIFEFTRMMGYGFSRKLAEALSSPTIWYYMAYVIIIFFLYYLFVSFFYDSRKIVTFLKNRQASIGYPPVENSEEYIDKSLEFMVPIAALYLCVVVFVPNAIFPKSPVSI